MADINEMRLQSLQAALVALTETTTPEDAPHVGRLTLRTATGRLVVDDAVLTEKSLAALLDQVTSLVERVRMDRAEGALIGAEPLPELDRTVTDEEFDAFLEALEDGEQSEGRES